MTAKQQIQSTQKQANVKFRDLRPGTFFKRKRDKNVYLILRGKGRHHTIIETSHPDSNYSNITNVIDTKTGNPFLVFPEETIDVIYCVKWK